MTGARARVAGAGGQPKDDTAAKRSTAPLAAAPRPPKDATVANDGTAERNGRAAPPRDATKANDGTAGPLTVTFRGGEYRVADNPGIWGLIQFSRAAKDGLTILDMDAMAALHAFLESSIHPDDWARFERDMIATRVARVEDLLDIAVQLVPALTAELMPLQGPEQEPATMEPGGG